MIVVTKTRCTILFSAAPTEFPKFGHILTESIYCGPQAAGGAALAAVGTWTVRETLTSSHFEGYALVLGAMLVSQGGLTLVMFLRLRDFRMAG